MEIYKCNKSGLFSSWRVGWVVKHQHTTEYIHLVCMSAKGPSNLAVFIAGAPGPPPKSEGTLPALHRGSRMGSGGREAGFP